MFRCDEGSSSMIRREIQASFGKGPSSVWIHGCVSPHSRPSGVKFKFRFGSSLHAIETEGGNKWHPYSVVFSSRIDTS